MITARVLDADLRDRARRGAIVGVMSSKGGVGKSTLATNLAGYFANQGHEVMLGDIDRQQSSREWL